MNIQEAREVLNALPANTVRELATDYWDHVAGADWDGKDISLLRSGEWYRHSEVMTIGLATYAARTI